jgi:hypothetical protein
MMDWISFYEKRADDDFEVALEEDYQKYYKNRVLY